MTPTVEAIAFLVGALCFGWVPAYIAGHVAAAKNRDGRRWMRLAVWFGIIALLIVIILPARRAETQTPSISTPGRSG
jgi:hypothetical protein